MDKNPFAEDDVPIEASLAALYEWLLTYGYFPVDSGELFNTRLDHNLGWAKCCAELGIMSYEMDSSHRGYYLTPKVHEFLKEYENGHRTDKNT